MTPGEAVEIATCELERWPEAGFVPRPPLFKFIEAAHYDRDNREAWPPAHPVNGRWQSVRQSITVLVPDGTTDDERAAWTRRYLEARDWWLERVRQRSREPGWRAAAADPHVLAWHDFERLREERFQALRDCRADLFDVRVHVSRPVRDPASLIDDEVSDWSQSPEGHAALRAAAAHCIEAGDPLPPALRQFAIAAMGERAPRQRGPAVDREFARAVTVARGALTACGLQVTRSEASAPRSALDAVAAAAGQLGRPTTYDALRMLLFRQTQT